MMEIGKMKVNLHMEIHQLKRALDIKTYFFKIFKNKTIILKLSF